MKYKAEAKVDGIKFEAHGDTRKEARAKVMRIVAFYLTNQKRDNV